ncbi:threonine synthase [bacterium]|nr:threonine synthase [bacterium]
MSNILHLQCVSCGKTYSTSDTEYTCPYCGDISGTLDVVYDYEFIKSQLSKASLENSHEYSHWRYLPLLPVDQPQLIPPLQVGFTPLYKAEKLGEQLGLNGLYIKDEGKNPTASMKDRASSIAVVKALEKGARVITTASTGNAASSLSAFAAVTGLDCLIFVPENAPRAKVAQLLSFGAKVLMIRGTYDHAFDQCRLAANKWQWYCRNTAINPYLGEGKKTAALEICEQLSWKAPDKVFVSVGDGCIIAGLWKGFQDFYRLGFIDKLPQLIGVQAEKAAPLVKAFVEGKDMAETLIPETVADSISVGNPRDQVKALRAVRESGGKMITVSDDQILEAIPLVARGSGVFGEPAGVAGYAGLRKMVDLREIDASEKIVVIITGNGLKDIDSAMMAVKEKPLIVEPGLDDIENALLSFGLF